MLDYNSEKTKFKALHNLSFTGSTDGLFKAKEIKIANTLKLICFKYTEESQTTIQEWKRERKLGYIS